MTPSRAENLQLDKTIFVLAFFHTFDPWRRVRDRVDACSWTCSPCEAIRGDSAGRTACRWRTRPEAALPSCGSVRATPSHDPWYPVSVCLSKKKNSITINKLDNQLSAPILYTHTHTTESPPKPISAMRDWIAIIPKVFFCAPTKESFWVRVDYIW